MKQKLNRLNDVLFDARQRMDFSNTIDREKKYIKKLTREFLDAFERVFDTYMVPFMEQLESVFGTVYQECRDVDRALWVYGHA